MKVVKRDGREVRYDSDKVRRAINKANEEVSGSDKVTEYDIDQIINFIENSCENSVKVEELQDIIEQQLVEDNKYNLAKRYIIYRYKRELTRKSNTTDNPILRLIGDKNEDLRDDNSNKESTMASTQRDLIAGEVSKDLSNRVLLPEKIVMAHKNGILHFHDMDYYLQKIFNCCLINIKDMLTNGTVLNGKMIESPKSFQVACTVSTQIMAAVASNQYGGQSIEIRHLAKYVRVSYEKYLKKLKKKYLGKLSLEIIEELALERTKDEIRAGVQTIQYQINTLMTTNGQNPFVTLLLSIDENDEYAKENALVIEEILRQRIKGIKNEQGVYVTPAFPKLVYVLDECNCLKGGKYNYLTKLAAECTSKRMYPDYISSKKMRERYEGSVFSPMGCRSFLSPWKDENGEYKFEGRFNQGVVTINLPQIGIVAGNDEAKFWEILDERLELCKEALICRHKSLLGTSSDISPIHWQYGAIARLGKGEKIDKYLMGGYSTLSLGYIGIYEMTKMVKGCSHTEGEGQEFAMSVMKYLREKTDSWKAETNLGFALYGTPAEGLCYRFAKIDKEKYGDIKDVTDKGYYTNSYHVDVREHIDAFTKFTFESQFQDISSGGAISYVEMPSMANNIEAIEDIITFIYDNIQYAEFNTKIDYCHTCGFHGEMKLNKKLQWECPNCGNNDRSLLTVIRRTCGYLGEKYWNVGKTKEIGSRVTHI